MPVLHIEHPITDFAAWTAAFNGFADRRRSGGVSRERVCRPSDDAHYIMIDLEFATEEQALAFLSFLRNVVWSTPVNSPALGGEPLTRILTIEYETSRPGEVVER